MAGYRRSSVAVLLSLVGSIALAGCDKPPPEPPAPRPVRAHKVSLEVQELRSTYTGEVRARVETALSFRVNGKIIAREVEVGSRVQKGQVLARLDQADLKLQQDSAKSQLAAVAADVEQARTDLHRYAKLFESGTISKADYDRRQTTYNAAAARLEQSRAQLRVSENQLTYGALIADADGIITSVQAEVGQVVTSGQAVFRLARPEEKEVVIAVSENRAEELRNAAEIRVSLWADPDHVFTGRLRELSPGVEAVTRTYTAKIAIQDPSPAVQLGMTANVTLVQRTPVPVAVLPLTAIYQQGKQPAVWVIKADTASVRLQPVQLAAYHENYAVVTSGVKNGDMVVTAGVHKLDEQQKIKLIDGVKAP